MVAVQQSRFEQALISWAPFQIEAIISFSWWGNFRDQVATRMNVLEEVQVTSFTGMEAEHSIVPHDAGTT